VKGDALTTAYGEHRTPTIWYTRGLRGFLPRFFDTAQCRVIQASGGGGATGTSPPLLPRPPLQPTTNNRRNITRATRRVNEFRFNFRIPNNMTTVLVARDSGAQRTYSYGFPLSEDDDVVVISPCVIINRRSHAPWSSQQSARFAIGDSVSVRLRLS